VRKAANLRVFAPESPEIREKLQVISAASRENSLLGGTMEFCRRSTNSNGRINRKAMEFLSAAKIGKWIPAPPRDRPEDRSETLPLDGPLMGEGLGGSEPAPATSKRSKVLKSTAAHYIIANRERLGGITPASGSSPGQALTRPHQGEIKGTGTRWRP
jgi:hypothetical protein